MVVLTILDHVGLAHFPAVPRPLVPYHGYDGLRQKYKPHWALNFLDKKKLRPWTNLVDVSDIFNFFFCSGREKGESEAPGFLIENPRRGGSPGKRGRGAGRVSAANWGIAQYCGGGGG